MIRASRLILIKILTHCLKQTSCKIKSPELSALLAAESDDYSSLPRIFRNQNFSENSNASAVAMWGSTALHNMGIPTSHKHRLLSQQAGQITPSWYQLSSHAQLSFTLHLPVTHHLLISFISTSMSSLTLLCVIMRKGQPSHPCTHSSKATSPFRALSKLPVKH